MTLGDLLETGWVKDSDELFIGHDGVRTAGQWFEDDVLSLTDREITAIIHTDNPGQWTLVMKEADA